jgi:hypothetical protein
MNINILIIFMKDFNPFFIIMLFLAEAVFLKSTPKMTPKE